MAGKEFYTPYIPGNEGGFGNNSTSKVFANPIRRDFGRKELPRVLDRENLPTVDEIREKVGIALSYFGERLPDNDLKKLSVTERYDRIELEKFKGQLSTEPNRVGREINQESLSIKCEPFSVELQRCLKKVKLDSTIVGNVEHLSLRTQGKEGEIIIDPSIGQFLAGYNHVFVGTRDELRKIVLEYAENKKLSILYKKNELTRTTVIEQDPNVFFEEQWPPLTNIHGFHGEEIISSPMIHPTTPPSPVIQPNPLVKELRPIISRKII